jgi:glycyl-tRNA synthetase
MVKDPKSGDLLRADHLVEEVLEIRLKGNKEARGQKDDRKAKQKKKGSGAVEAIRLEDAVVQEYEEILAKVCCWFTSGEPLVCLT